jgi:hypothetical protein
LPETDADKGRAGEKHAEGNGKAPDDFNLVVGLRTPTKVE